MGGPRLSAVEGLFLRSILLDMSRPAELGSAKEGSNIVIDGEPCRVVGIEKSKTGKHGSATVRVSR